MLNLTTATVVGFFSLPSVSLAEANPDAYNAAMANLPANAGSCNHCGTGIVHHVVVKLADGETAFIGTSCAEKVGCERVRQCVKDRITEEQLVEKEAKLAARRGADEALIAKVAEERAARYELFKDTVDILRAQQTEFHSSLASQLVDGPLSDKQACYVMKAVIGRETKKNSDQWWSLYEQITSKE